MTDDSVHTNLFAIYLQLTPWVQAFLAFTVCVAVLGIAYFFKETIRALLQPFQHRRLEHAGQTPVSDPQPPERNGHAIDVKVLDHRQRLLGGLDA